MSQRKKYVTGSLKTSLNALIAWTPYPATRLGWRIPAKMTAFKAIPKAGFLVRRTNTKRRAEKQASPQIGSRITTQHSAGISQVLTKEDHTVSTIVSERVLAIMKDAGYEAEHAGGICMAWVKRPDSDTRTTLCISNYSNYYELDGDPDSPEWMVGRYSVINCGSIEYGAEVTLRDAIAIAERLPPPILDDGTDIQETVGPNRLFPAAEG
jgi:hypothetical protein